MADAYLPNGEFNLCEVLTNHANLINSGLTSVKLEGTNLIETNQSGAEVATAFPRFQDKINAGLNLSQSLTANTFTLTGGDYQINNNLYSITSATTVVLDAGDPSNIRFDKITVDINENVNVLKGTASSSPTIPSTPSDEVGVATVRVDAGANTSGGYTILDNLEQSFFISAGTAVGQMLSWDGTAWSPLTGITFVDNNYSQIITQDIAGTIQTSAFGGSITDESGVTYSNLFTSLYSNTPTNGNIASGGLTNRYYTQGDASTISNITGITGLLRYDNNISQDYRGITLYSTDYGKTASAFPSTGPYSGFSFGVSLINKFDSLADDNIIPNTFKHNLSRVENNITNVDASVTSAYTLTNEEYIVAVDTSVSAITINLPNAPKQGRVYKIVDKGGKASVNNITIEGTDVEVGNNRYQKVITKDYGSISFIFDIGGAPDGRWYSLSDNTSNITVINNKHDLPRASSGVITIPRNYKMLVTNEVDLEGDRLVFDGDAALHGFSSETSKLLSTGLSGNPMVTATNTLSVQNITFEHDQQVLDIDCSGSTSANFDWKSVNFNDCPNIGTIANVDNFIYKDGALLSSANLNFDGTFNTIAFEGSLFINNGSGDTIVFGSGATINRRFRTIYSVMVNTNTGTTLLNVPTGVTIPTQGYILDTVDFSGGGGYLEGYTSLDEETKFVNNTGIDNTRSNGIMYFSGTNTTVTTISSTGTYVKISGDTIPNGVNSKFSHSTNRLTYTGRVNDLFKVHVTLSATAGNNNDIKFGVYSSKLGAVADQSEVLFTTDGTGKAQNVSTQLVLRMEENDFIEIWCANDTSTTDITVERMNVSVLPI